MMAHANDYLTVVNNGKTTGWARSTNPQRLRPLEECHDDDAHVRGGEEQSPNVGRTLTTRRRMRDPQHGGIHGRRNQFSPAMEITNLYDVLAEPSRFYLTPRTWQSHPATRCRTYKDARGIVSNITASNISAVMRRVWEMWDHLVAIPDSPEGLMTALKAWLASGLYRGFRLSEWAQHDQHANIAEPARDELGIPLAFCLEDLEFRGIGNKRIALAEAYTMREEDIARAWVTLSHQKNGDHGEKRMFTWNKGSPDKCCCRQLHRAFKRFIQLCRWAYGKPLSVYKDAHGIVRNITAQNISAVMRQVASELYGLDPVRHKKGTPKVVLPLFTRTRMRDLTHYGIHG